MKFSYIMCLKDKPLVNGKRQSDEWLEGNLIWCDKRRYPELKLLVFSLTKELWVFRYNLDVDTKTTTIRWGGRIKENCGLLESKQIYF